MVVSEKIFTELENQASSGRRNDDNTTSVVGSKHSYLVMACRSLVIEGEHFEPQFSAFVISCIVLAGILVSLTQFPTSNGLTISPQVGVQTFPGMDSDQIVQGLDWFVLAVFAFECTFKIIAEWPRPWAYFVGKEWKWNDFDFLIVLFSLPFVGSVFGGEGASISFLRLLRLARLVKLVKKIPQLQIIVMGLAGGLNSIAYIMLLLAMVFYLYSILGIYAFRENDPWHFRDVPTAFLTLFRAATLEDWTDIMYINIYGCDEYPGGIYSAPSKNNTGEDFLCRTPHANPVVGPIFWVSFIIVAGMVMLSLFVGAVTMSMSESMNRMNEEKEAKRAKQVLQRKQELEQQVKMEEQKCLSAVPKVRDSSNGRNSWQSRAVQLHAIKETRHATSDEIRDIKAIRQMKCLLRGAWQRRADAQTFLARPRETGVSEAEDDPDLVLTFPPGLWGEYLKLAERSKEVAEHPLFNTAITLVIVLAGVLVGIQTNPKIVENASAMKTFDVLDAFILLIFILEVIIKIVAEGSNPHRYFFNSWNCFDFLIVLASILNLFVDVGSGGSGGLITMLRLLRLLRVLKLVKRFPQLAIIVDALMMGIGSIGFIGVILFLVYYMFAIAGMVLFRDNDTWHFGSLPMAMLTLFRVSTLEDWTDVMYINIYGCNRYGYDDEMRCETESQPSVFSALIAVFYFCGFVVIASLVLLTLFVGVVTTAMEEATLKRSNEDTVRARLEDFARENDLDKETVKSYTEVFHLLDLDSSGFLEKDELIAGLEAIGEKPTEDEINKWLDGLDKDSNDVIDCAEFVKFIWRSQGAGMGSAVKESSEDEERENKQKVVS